MDSLFYYLEGTVSPELTHLYKTVLSQFDTLGVDIHIPMIDSLLATADDRDDSEVLAFLESIIYDQTHSILMAHLINASPESMKNACAYLNTLITCQDLGGDEVAYGILEGSESPDEAWAELTAYVNNTQAEDYLSEIKSVELSAIDNIISALEENDATEDEDYDDESSDDVRREALPWVRERIKGFLSKDLEPTPTVLAKSVTDHGMKLALPIDTLWGALSEEVLDLPERAWPRELITIALASRLGDDKVDEWVSATLSQYTDDPSITKSALQILHKRIAPNEETN